MCGIFHSKYRFGLKKRLPVSCTEVRRTGVKKCQSLLFYISKPLLQVYFWKNDSGEVIKGNGLQTFSPTCIAMKDESLKKFGMYLLRFLPGPPKL